MRIRDRIAGGIAALAMRNLGAVTNRVVFVQSHDDPLDNYRCTGHDSAGRGITERSGQCFRANHQQPQHNSVEGSVFIELALALPLLMIAIWGSLAVYQVVAMHLALTDAATVGIEAWSAGNTEQQVVQAVDVALSQDHLSPSTVTCTIVQNGQETTVGLTSALTVPILGSLTIQAKESSYGAS